MTALAQLPHRQRVAIVLHHLADLSVERVAEETGASVSAVKKQLVRGRAAMAVALAEGRPDHDETAESLDSHARKAQR